MSLAAMMRPTNDGFIAVTDMPLPRGKQAVAYLSNVHDAGSEPNDELCASIPGPTCQGEGGSPGVQFRTEYRAKDPQRNVADVP